MNQHTGLSTVIPGLTRDLVAQSSRTPNSHPGHRSGILCHDESLNQVQDDKTHCHSGLDPESRCCLRSRVEPGMTQVRGRDDGSMRSRVISAVTRASSDSTNARDDSGKRKNVLATTSLFALGLMLAVGSGEAWGTCPETLTSNPTGGISCSGSYNTPAITLSSTLSGTWANTHSITGINGSAGNVGVLVSTGANITNSGTITGSGGDGAAGVSLLGTLTLQDGSTLDASTGGVKIDSSGTLNITGTPTITGTINGAADNEGTINIGDGTTAGTYNQNQALGGTNALNIANVNAAATWNMNANAAVDTVNITGSGALLNVNSGAVLTGNVVMDGAGSESIQFSNGSGTTIASNVTTTMDGGPYFVVNSGTYTFSGDVGATSKSFNQIQIGNFDETTATFTGNVYAQSLDMQSATESDPVRNFIYNGVTNKTANFQTFTGGGVNANITNNGIMTFQTGGTNENISNFTNSGTLSISAGGGFKNLGTLINQGSGTITINTGGSGFFITDSNMLVGSHPSFVKIADGAAPAYTNIARNLSLASNGAESPTVPIFTVSVPSGTAGTLSCGPITIGGTDQDGGTMVITGGTVASSGTVTVSTGGTTPYNNLASTLTLSGTGALTTTGIILGSGSTFTYSSGTALAATTPVYGSGAGCGTFNINANHTSSVALGVTGLLAINVGNSATWTMNANATATSVTIGGGASGTLTQTAGTLTGAVTLGSGAIYNYNGGTLATTINGDSAGRGTLNINTSLTRSTAIGESARLATIAIGSGTWTMTGTAAATAITVGNGATWTMGANATATSVTIGGGASGTLTQTAGTLTGAVALGSGAIYNYNTGADGLVGTLNGFADNQGIFNINTNFTNASIIGGTHRLATIAVDNNATWTVSANATTQALTMAAGTVRNAATITATNAVSPTGTYTIVVAGTNGDATYGQLVSTTGNIDLSNATLTVDISGLTLTSSQTYTVLTAGANYTIQLPAGNPTIVQGNNSYTVTLTSVGATGLGGLGSPTVRLTIAPPAAAASAGGGIVQATQSTASLSTSDLNILGIDGAGSFSARDTQALQVLAGKATQDNIKMVKVLARAIANGTGITEGQRVDLGNFVIANGAGAVQAKFNMAVPSVSPSTTAMRQVASTLNERIVTNQGAGFLNFGPALASEKGKAAAAGSGAFGGVGPGGAEGAQMWVKALGSKETQDRIGSYQGYDTQTKGMVGGITTTIHPGTQVGVAYSFNESKALEKLDSVSSTNSKSYMLALYGALSPQSTWFADGSLLMGISQNKNNRLDFARSIYSKNAKSYTGGVNGRLGYNVKTTDERLNVRPFMATQFSLTHTPSSLEGGGTLPITLKKDNQYSAQVGFGTSASYAYTVNEDWRALPEISAQYMHEFNGKSRIVEATWLGQPIGINTPELGTEIVNLGAGVKVKSRDGISLSFDYTATLKNKYVGHTGFVKLSWGF
jgi:uncharacterized protein with beta-barrel porin domain